MKRSAIILALTIVTAAFLSCKSNPNQKASGFTTTTASPTSLKSLDYVTDDAKAIDESSRKQLEATLAALKARKQIDFAVVTVKTTGDQTVRDYSLDLARQRKANSNEQNVSGLLLLVAVDDRKWHMQISRNLEDDLTNEILTNLSAPMTDLFKEKRYGEGITKYVNAVIAELEKRIRNG
jgi:uncharacterized protein